MSFGWSAGDIAEAIKLVYSIYETLDSCNGAASEYREATSFLKELTHTLQPLKSFAAWGAYPEYGKEITDQVGFIKEPVENLLQEIVKLEPSLGFGATLGRRRYVIPKLNWHFRVSKRVLDLRRRIEPHMRILDSLLQRLTLDVVYKTQQSLPDIFVSVFQERIRPELIRTLQDISDTARQHRSPSPGPSVLPELYSDLLSQMDDLKRIAADSRDVQLRLESCLSAGGRISSRLPTLLPSSNSRPLEDLESEDVVTSRHMRPLSHDVSEIDQDVARESLREVYYLVLLYLGEFLRNLFLLLSRHTRPSRQLGQVLIAKFNITFLDPIGRPPRVLPYEFFRNFEYFRVFLGQEFRGLSLVERGQYLLMSKVDNRRLDEKNWHRNVSPGSTVSMAALISREQRTENGVSRCPEPACKGTWKATNLAWSKCPVCGKEVFTLGPRLIPIPGPFDPEAQQTPSGYQFDDPTTQFTQTVEDESNPASQLGTFRRTGHGISGPEVNSNGAEGTTGTDEGISIFKRIVRLVNQDWEDEGGDLDVFFDWSKSPLEKFWCFNHAQPRTASHIPWMADQFYKLAISLHRLHLEMESHISVQRKGRELPTDYETPRPFVIRPHITYRAPDYDLTGVPLLSISSDIYSMGCVFLEYITWFLLGEDGADRFTRARTTRETPNSISDIFFTMSQDRTTTRLKKGVKGWIQHLYNQDNRSEYLWCLLHFIETRMLESDHRKRAGIVEIKVTLRRLRDTFRRSRPFYEKFWEDRVISDDISDVNTR